MVVHFEHLWEESEKLHAHDNSSISSVIEELLMKVNLYKIIEERTDIPDEERQKVKSRTLGEILLSLTHLSVKDNINVFQALKVANQHRSAEKLAKIPHNLRLPGSK